MVDDELRGRMAADDREIALAHSSRFELRGEIAAGRAIECEQQDTGGRLVEPVHRIDFAAELVTQHLQSESCLVTVDVRPVNEEAGRLVDRDDPVVRVQDGQRGIGR